jgi:hypothetical protein
MSGKEAEVDICCCANCGVAEVDEIKLDTCCDGCDLVKYCKDKCMEEHREQHEEDCKKRKAELHDKQLFTQPPGTHLGECPLCFLPMPLDDTKKYTFYSCCSTYICHGCEYVHHIRNGNDNCPFCREPTPDDEEDWEKNMMKRIKADDPVAMCFSGTKLYHEGDCDSAVKYWTKAAKLGDPEAHYQLSTVYREGEGVEKDEEKEVYHLEKAAIGGHPDARYNLGCVESARYKLACVEGRNGNIERAVKHFIIAANVGYEDSMKALWKEFRYGNITKEDLDATLRTHQAAIDEMKSPEREAAAVWRKRGSPLG